MDVDVVIIGVDEDNPLVEIKSVGIEKINNYQKIKYLESVVSIANVAAQAAPILFAAKEVASKQIMEVVLNGTLSKAADGNGLRAFSRTFDGKFEEHARLFHPEKLQGIVGVGAIWQIASVIVAQKHLADINKRLEELQGSVEHIINFLETERKSRLLSVYESLKELTKSLDIIDSDKKEKIISFQVLHSYDDTLKQIYLHLKDDVVKYGLKKVEHKEMFGTGALNDDINKKISRVNILFNQAFFCLSLRVACCDLMSHLEGGAPVKEVFRENILKELEVLLSLVFDIKNFMNKEVDLMSSVVNDASKFLNNNKKFAVTAGVGFLSGGIITGMASLVVAGKGIRKKIEPGVLDQRKLELLDKINQLVLEFLACYESIKNRLSPNCQYDVNKQPSVKLAFQRLDDTTLLCLNTGEKIIVK